MEVCLQEVFLGTDISYSHVSSRTFLVLNMYGIFNESMISYCLRDYNINRLSTETLSVCNNRSYAYDVLNSSSEISAHGTAYVHYTNFF